MTETSQKAKWTPGPWAHSFNGHYFQINDENGYQIGDACSSQYINGTKDNPDLDLAEANARLIAAAPDLLQELKYLVMHCKGLDRFEGNPINEAIAAARALISRVEG